MLVVSALCSAVLFTQVVQLAAFRFVRLQLAGKQTGNCTWLS